MTRTEGTAQSGQGQVVNAGNLFEKVVLINLKMPAFSGITRVRPGTIVGDWEERRAAHHKKILDCEELRACLAFRREVRNWVRKRSIPSFFRSGMHTIAAKSAMRICDYLKERADELPSLVGAFLAKVEEVEEQDKRLLGSLYDPEDYLEPDEIASQFGIDWTIITLSAPGEKVAELAPEFFLEERAKFVQDKQDELDNAKAYLRGFVLEVARHITERLGTKKDGKPMVFRDTLLEDAKLLFEEFDALNFAGDDELARVVERMKKALRGGNVPLDALRSDADLRGKTEKVMTGIKRTLDGLLIERPSRNLTLEGE